jgi:phosphate transport system protein
MPTSLRDDNDGDGRPGPRPEPLIAQTPVTAKRLQALQRRLSREGGLAVSMLEGAIDALWRLDVEAARQVRFTDDQIDNEEIAIELECHEILALHNPIAKDLRLVTFALRVNSDFERVGDHASSIAKTTLRLQPLFGAPDPTGPSHIPTSLRDLGLRVPAMCHDLLRALADLDVDLARRIVQYDPTIDAIEKRVLDEVMSMVRARNRADNAILAAMHLARAGRELERVGDLMSACAEDLIFLLTGEIVRHAKRRVQRPLDPPQ